MTIDEERDSATINEALFANLLTHYYKGLLTMIGPLMIGLVVNLVYDVAKRGKGEFDERTHLWQSVRDAAAESVDEFPSVSEDELYAVFVVELSDEDLQDLLSRDREIVIQDLSERLERRDSVPDGIDHELLIDDFLDKVEFNLLSHNRPEEAFSTLLRYAQESKADHTDIKSQLNTILSEFKPDLKRLSRRSERMFPDRDQFTLRESDVTIDRDEQEEIRDVLEESSSVLVSGDAGVGKSGVVAQTAHQIRDDGRTIYFIDAREFSGISSIGDIEDELGIGRGIEAVLGSVAENASGCVLVIDQLDNVEGTETGRALQNLILDCVDVPKLDVLCACRNWELSQDQYEQIRECDSIDEVSVGDLSRKRSEEALHEVGVEETNMTGDILDLSTNMLNLSLLSSALTQTDGDMNVAQIKSEASLWKVYIDSLGREATSEKYSEGVSKEDVLDRAIHHSRTSLREARSTFVIDRGNPADNRLRSRGVINNGRGRRYRFHHDQLQTFFYAWDASSQTHFASEILNDGIDNRVAADVLVWLFKIYSENDDSRESMLPGFLRDSLGRYSSVRFYSRAVLADAISNMNPSQITETSFDIIIEALENDHSLRREFFRNCDNITWAEKIIEFEVVEKLPGSGIRFIGEFTDQKPGIVVESMEAITDADEGIITDYVRLLVEMNGRQAAAGSTIICDWINSIDLKNMDMIGSNLVSIFKQLMEDDQYDAATNLLSILFESERPEPVVSQVYDDLDEVPERHKYRKTNALPRVDIHWLEEIPQLISGLAEEQGKSVVEEIDEKYSQAIEYEADCLEGVEPSEVPQPTSVYQYSSPSNDLKSVLLYTLLKATEGWVKADGSQKPDSQLEKWLSDGDIYRRLALYMLSQDPDRFSELVSKELLARENYRSTRIWHEFLLLLESGYSALNAEEKEKVRDIILAGPSQEYTDSLVEFYEENQDIEDPVEAATLSNQRWIRDRLWMIRDDISGEDSENLEEMIDKHGKPTNITVTGKLPSVEENADSDESDLTQYLNGLSSTNFVEYCVEGADELRVPGEIETEHIDDQYLSMKLLHRAREHPNKYVQHLSDLDDSENNVYLQQALTGIDSALTLSDGKLIGDWEPVVEMAIVITDRPKDYDRNVLDAISELFYHMVGSKQSDFSLTDHSDATEKILTNLLFLDENPPSETDSEMLKEKLQGGVSVAPSNIQARAFDALMWYIAIQAPESYSPESGDDLEELRVLFGEMTEAFPKEDVELRITMGRNLSRIWYYFPNLFSEHVDKLLPEEGHLEQFMSVWHGYLARSDMIVPEFDTLKPKYQYAIAHLQTELGEMVASSRSGDTLSYYIAHAYIEDLLSGPDDQMITNLLTEGNESLRTSFAHYLYQTVSDAGASGERSRIWQKIRDYWEWRSSNLNVEKLNGEELAKYLRCLEELPSINVVEFEDLLLESVEATLLDGYQNSILERYLASKVHENERAVMHIYLTSLENRLDEKSPIYPTDDCFEIISTAVKNSASQEDALEAAESLFSRGHHDYRRIIEQYSQTDLC